MKRSSLYVVAAALIAAFTLALLPTQPTVSADDHGDKDVLHEAMEELGSLYSSLRRQAYKAVKSDDAAEIKELNADNAEKLKEMISLSVKAKDHLPPTASTADLKQSYRVIMNKLIVALANAENAALAGETEKVKDYVLEANSAKGEGHELFIPEEE